MKRIEFKYHPNLYSDEILIHEEGVCNCCGRKVPEYIGTAYSPEDTDCICLSCIHDGSAAEKLNAEFVQFAEDVSDPEKRDELFKRTPGYMSWQGENWLACCDDYCAYLGTVGIRELQELGIKDQEDMQIYAIITIPQGKIEDMTANLTAPVVLNQKNMQAKQVVLEKGGYTTKHRLFPEKKK